MNKPFSNERLQDLVYYARDYLHDAGLLSDEEYGLLASGDSRGAVRRLEENAESPMNGIAVANASGGKQMKPAIPEWMQRVLEDAKARVCQWPQGLRGPELQAIFDRKPADYAGPTWVLQELRRKK